MRNIKKNIEEYRRIVALTGRGKFYPDEVMQIAETSESIIEAICKALMIAWIIGYRAGRKGVLNEKES